MNKLRIVSSLFLALMLLCVTAMPVRADTANPDSTPVVEQIDIYRNLIETGDWLVLIYANIPYATPPTTVVSNTFIWRLIDTDNVTQLGSTTGYPFDNDGYGYNVYSMYFNAANVTALGMIWGTTYILRLSGNPAVFDTPPEYNYDIAAGDYTILTTQDDNQAALASRVLVLGATLEIRWGETPGTLITQSEAGTVLSTYGEAFFRGAIYGLQSMAPTVFSAIIRSLDVSYRTWDEEYAENITDQWSGTWIDTAREGSKALFGTSYDLGSIIIVLLGVFGVIFATIWLGGPHWVGWLDASVIAVSTARLGMYPLGFLLLLSFGGLVYWSSRLWFRVFR